MEIRQLEYFVAVVDEGSFTAAARREHVAQPAVSAQLQRLERLVGQPLFDRARRTVRLTEAGAAMLPHARAALAAVRAAQAAVDDVTDLVRGTLSVGTVTAHDVDVARLLADFHGDYPDVEISLGTANSDELIAALRDGRIDAAIVSIGIDEEPDGLDVDVVTAQPIAAAVSRDDPLSSHASITLAQLCERPLIALPAGTGLRTTLDAACKREGLVPHIAFEASSPLALADLAEHGLGVAIVPESVAHGRPSLHALRIAPQLRGRLVWAWARGTSSPAARVLRERAGQLLVAQ